MTLALVLLALGYALLASAIVIIVRETRRNTWWARVDALTRRKPW